MSEVIPQEVWQDGEVYVMYHARDYDALKTRLDLACAALARLQYPEGELEGRVAEWLRGKGYSVTDPRAAPPASRKEGEK